MTPGRLGFQEHVLECDFSTFFVLQGLASIEFQPARVYL